MVRQSRLSSGMTTGGQRASTIRSVPTINVACILCAYSVGIGTMCALDTRFVEAVFATLFDLHTIAVTLAVTLVSCASFRLMHVGDDGLWNRHMCGLL